MSALQTLILRNNVQHLVDCSVQQRVHWVASTATESLTASVYSPFVWVFPITNTDRNRYPSFDIRVAVRSTGTKSTGTIGVNLTDAISNTSILFHTHSVGSTSATWHSQSTDVAYPWEGRASRISYRDPSITGSPSTVTTSAGYILGMLQVTITPGTSGTGDIVICGVSVREYLSE